MAERPEAHVNLSNLYLRQGRAKEAEDELNTALRLDPRSIPALVNLADLCRATGREPEAVRHLEKAVRHLAAGCGRDRARARPGLHPERPHGRSACHRLERAYRLRPGDSRYGYAYAVGLDSQGKTAEAVEGAGRVQRLRPADREVLAALATCSRRSAAIARAAIGWAQKLVDLRPEDREARALLAQVRRRRGRSARVQSA